jgi:BolA protein
MSIHAPIQQQIEHKIQEALSPLYLKVENESYMHAVPENAETHFKVVVVADSFEGKRAVQRHQLVYGLLRAELEGEVHALAIHTYTPDEWGGINGAPDSPGCMGGSKVDH